MRRWVPALALFASLLVTPLASASSAVVLAPVDLEGASLASGPGTLDLHQGDAPLSMAVSGGIADVWTRRTTCLQPSEETCIPSSGETGQRTIVLGPGGVSIAPADSRAYRLLVSLEAGSLDVSSPAMRLDLLDEPTDRLLASGTPERFAGTELAEGLVLQAGDGATVTARGPMTVRSLNATLSFVDVEGQARELVTGWSWEPGENGVNHYRQLVLVNLQVDGAFTVPWDGRVTSTGELPASLSAERASLDLADGSLDHEAGTARPGSGLVLDDLRLRITGIDDEAGDHGGFVVEQGSLPVESAADEERGDTAVLLGAGAAFAAVVGAVAYYWPRMTYGLAIVGLPMYSRIQKSELLDHEVRETLYQVIQTEPGIHAHALSEKAEIGWGTTVYHLRLMERNRLITSERKGRYRRFFPAAGFLAKKREVLSVLQNDTTNAIARLVLKKPGLNQKAVCEELDISPSLANWHMNRLLEAELVRRERRGRTVHYYPGEAWNDVDDVVDVPGTAA